LTDPTLHDKLIDTMPNDPTIITTIELTEREKEILRLVATGTGNKEIARQLFISSNTVKVHVRNIFAKIGVATRTEAAMYAVRTGLVQTPGLEKEGFPQARPSGDNFHRSSDSSSQSTGELPEESLLPASQTAAIRLPLRNLNGVPLARVAAVIVILLVVISTGFVLARRQAAPPTALSRITITPTPQSRWHTLASLPTARDGLAVTAYENHVYAIGGETALGVTGLMEIYDPASNVWTKLTQKPVPVTDINAAVIGGRIYVPGGRTTSGAVTATLDIYDPRLDTWEKGTELPVAMSAYAMAAFEGRIYLFGGWDGQNYLNTVYIYSPESESWSVGKPMSVARGFAGAAVAGGKVYVVGGENQEGKLSLNEVNDLRLDSSDVSDWQTDEPLPAPASGISLINVADLVYAVVSENGLNGVYVYHNIPDVKNKSWELLPMPYEFGPHFNSVMLGTRLYIMGGYLNKKQLSLNIAYDAIYTIILPITK
jgi:DNA-binding CsgD family transcriptional regulator